MFAQQHRQLFVARALSGEKPDADRWLHDRLKPLVETRIEDHALATDQEDSYPTASVQALADIGALGITVSPSLGGLGFGHNVAALAVEMIAHACPTTAAILMFHTQVVERIRQFGNDIQRGRLPALASGEWMASSAWTEFGGGPNKTFIRTTLQSSRNGLVVSGEKHFCTGLARANVIHALVNATGINGRNGPTFVELLTSAEGVDIAEHYALLGLRGSSTGTVKLSDVCVNHSAIVFGVGAGRDLMSANHRQLMNPGLIALGTASRAIHELVETLHRTESYGNAVALNTLAGVEMLLGAAYDYAAGSFQAGPAEQRQLLNHRIKAHCTQTAAQVTTQVLDAIGSRAFIAGHIAERCLRNAQATVLMGPSNAMIKANVADALLSGQWLTNEKQTGTHRL